MKLIGPNGAGESTTIRILPGLVHQDSGDVRVRGHRMPAGQIAAKWAIGFASEDMRLEGGARRRGRHAPPGARMVPPHSRRR
jgi:ABC-2 type transport system ATP-binding protein